MSSLRSVNTDAIRCRYAAGSSAADLAFSGGLDVTIFSDFLNPADDLSFPVLARLLIPFAFITIIRDTSCADEKLLLHCLQLDGGRNVWKQMATPGAAVTQMKKQAKQKIQKFMEIAFGHTQYMWSNTRDRSCAVRQRPAGPRPPPAPPCWARPTGNLRFKDKCERGRNTCHWWPECRSHDGVPPSQPANDAQAGRTQAPGYTSAEPRGGGPIRRVRGSGGQSGGLTRDLTVAAAAAPPARA